MRRVALGNTGLQVSRLGIGTDVLRDQQGPEVMEREADVLLCAWELGVNLIDTDRWYRTYPAIAQALPHMVRDELVLITKTYEKTAEGALSDVCYALETMQCGHIDVFLLHAVDSDEHYQSVAGLRGGLWACGITSDGKVKGCLSMPAEFVEGDLRQQSFWDIWFRPDAFAYNRQFTLDQLGPDCRDCPVGDQCKGGCSMMSWGSTHSLHNDPYCFLGIERRATQPLPAL